MKILAFVVRVAVDSVYRQKELLSPVVARKKNVAGPLFCPVYTLRLSTSP